MREERSVWVDHAKAIGIMLVVYGHIARGLQNSDIEKPSQLLTLIDGIIYSFHMPLFFFLAGLFFIQSLTEKGASGTVLSKVDTIFYPYLLWSILQGSAEALMADYTNGGVSFKEVFSLLWAPRAQFWFLYALFFVGVVCTLLYSRHLASYGVLIFAISIILYLFSEYFSAFIIPYFIAGHLVFFSMGIFFKKHLKIEYFRSMAALILSAAAFITAQWIFHIQLGIQNSESNMIHLVVTTISIVFVVSVSANLSRLKLKFLAYVGASSLAIYVMHVMAGSGTRIMLKKLLNIDSFEIHLIVGFLFAILAPLVVSKAIETLKIRGIFSAPISQIVMNTHQKLLKCFSN